MNAEVKDYVSKCSVCQAHQPEQCRESMKSYSIAPRPCSLVGEDLFQLGHVEELTKVTSKSVITASKVQFARHGIPDTLISDNGSQFVSAKICAVYRRLASDIKSMLSSV